MDISGGSMEDGQLTLRFEGEQSLSKLSIEISHLSLNYWAFT